MEKNARSEHYQGFKGKRMRVTNTANANVKLYLQDLTSF